MGKIRVKTIGDDAEEKKQKAEAKKRKEAKKVEASEVQSTKKAADDVIAIRQLAEKQSPAADPLRRSFSEPSRQGQDDEIATDSSSPRNDDEDKQTASAKNSAEPKKSKYAAKQSTGRRSENYKNALSQVEKTKFYSLKEALTILPKVKLSSFDETVELHINTTETGVSGSLTLPHGTGKTARIVIANQTTDPAGVDELVKTIESGKIEFDVLIATPDAMPKLARVAKFLGPRGLMPNPKAGTVTPKPEDVAKKFEAGQINFKTEAKFPIIHVSVGKLSFGDDKLTDNIKAVLTSVQTKRVKNVTLKSTMSPAIKLNTASL